MKCKFCRVKGGAGDTEEYALSHLPTTMGFFQPGTRRGTLSTTMGSLKTVPFRMLRMVPLGLLHIFFSLNSFTRASSGVMVAHLMPTPLAYSQTYRLANTLSFGFRGFLLSSQKPQQIKGRNMLSNCHFDSNRRRQNARRRVLIGTRQGPA